MFGFVKKELLQSAEAQISNLSQRLSDLESENSELGELLKLAQSDLAQIKSSELLKSAVTLEELKNEIIAREEQKLAIETEIIEIKDRKLEIIQCEVNKEKELLEDRQRADIEFKLKGLVEEKDRISTEVIEAQSRLDVLVEKISAATNELDEIVDRTLAFEALDTVGKDYVSIGGQNSQEIKINIEKLREQQKQKISDKTAWLTPKHYTLDGSLSEGKAQQKRLANFLLSAFNVHVDNIISSSKRGNFQALHKKIEQWFEKINKIGSDHHIYIDRDYLILRLQELKEYCRHHIQVEMEREEERYINELIREEAVAQREIETFVKNKEREELECLKEISKLSNKIETEKDENTVKLESQVAELKQKLYILQKEKQRAMSMAQLTRSGHVYIISNKGSFGPDVYKIGMTRRLDPMDRVRELGDASVPFYFDVHGIIHTEDAPTLERELHKAFDDRRVNSKNYRREFFRVKIEEIEEVISRVHGSITLDRDPH
jgi:hypothetical protein